MITSLLIIYQYLNTDILKLNLNLSEDTGILIMYSNVETGITLLQDLLYKIIRGEDNYGFSYRTRFNGRSKGAC